MATSQWTTSCPANLCVVGLAGAEQGLCGVPIGEDDDGAKMRADDGADGAAGDKAGDMAGVWRVVTSSS